MNTSSRIIVSVEASGAVDDTDIGGEVTIESRITGTLAHTFPSRIIPKSSWWASLNTSIALIIRKRVSWAIFNTVIGQVVCKGLPLRAVTYTLSCLILPKSVVLASENTRSRGILCIRPRRFWTLRHTSLCGVISVGTNRWHKSLIWTCLYTPKSVIICICHQIQWAIFNTSFCVVVSIHWLTVLNTLSFS